MERTGKQVLLIYIWGGGRFFRRFFFRPLSQGFENKKLNCLPQPKQVDSIGSARGGSGGGGGDSEVQRTMLELLNQLDGFESTNKIKVGVFSRLHFLFVLLPPRFSSTSAVPLALSLSLRLSFSLSPSLSLSILIKTRKISKQK